MKRKVAHTEKERQEFISLGFKEVGKEENGNFVFWSNKIEDILSSRELSIYKMRDLNVEAIAEHLSISIKSVESYLVKIKAKL